MKAKIIKLQKYYKIPEVDPRIAVTPRTTHDIFYSLLIGPSSMKQLRSIFPIERDDYLGHCELWKNKCVSFFGYRPLFFHSSTADNKNIDNYPYTDYIQYNILASNRLLMGLLVMLADKIEIDLSSVICTSAYRCDELNKAVGGSVNSLHKEGLAYDLVFPSQYAVDEFVDIVVDYCKCDDLLNTDKPTLVPYEIIKYTKGNRVHIGFNYMILRDF